MKNNIESLAKPCAGCGACTVVCPTHAIRLAKNKDGFYTASVDESRCMDCQKCKLVCVRGAVEGTMPLQGGNIFSAQSKDADVVQRSSSGGIAYEMSRFALQNGICVVGSIYDYDTNRVRAILTDDPDALLQMQGSKYLQSITDDAYSELVSAAMDDTGKNFLLFCTPCQAYGIASVLEQLKLRDRAIIVDFFCHGVPSYTVWDQYLSDIASITGGGKLKSVSFRDKKIGWHNFVMRIEGQKGVYQRSSEADWFYRMFFDNVMLSEACFDCPVRQAESKADIRLGDCWGSRYQDKEDGVSAVLSLTERGKSFLKKMQKMDVIDSLEIDEVLQAQSVQPYAEKTIHQQAFDCFRNTGSIGRTVKLYRRQFGYRRRIKTYLKECSSYLPDKMRAKIRNIYRKI